MSTAREEPGKPRMGDRAIRASMTVTVLGVAVVAGWVSYWHAVEVVRRYGAEQDPAIHLIPLTIDGMIYASSMAMLWSARYGLKTGWLSRTALVVGIAATLAANVLQGLEHGPLAAAIAAWPAVALVISYELTMWVVRSGREIADSRTVPGPDHSAEAAGTDPDRSVPAAPATLADGDDARATVQDEVGKLADEVGKPVGKADERLAEARRLDARHRAEKGRPISAENLARAMRVGKPTALKLVKTMRQEFAQAGADGGQDLADPAAQTRQTFAQGLALAGTEPA